MSSDMLSYTHRQDSRPSDPGVDEKDDDDDEQPAGRRFRTRKVVQESVSPEPAGRSEYVFSLLSTVKSVIHSLFMATP